MAKIGREKKKRAENFSYRLQVVEVCRSTDPILRPL